jgi:hypothetical protein
MISGSACLLPPAGMNAPSRFSSDMRESRVRMRCVAFPDGSPQRPTNGSVRGGTKLSGDRFVEFA